MKIEAGKTYRVEFLRDIPLIRVENGNFNMTEEVICVKGEIEEVEVVEVNEEAQVVTFFYNAETSDEIDTFSSNVPMDCFKLIEEKKIVWEVI